MSTSTPPAEHDHLDPAIPEDLHSMPTGKNGGPLGGRFLSATANYIDERTSLSGFV